MAMNRIQFQKGLSLPAFLEKFGTEGHAKPHWKKLAGPMGFVVRAVDKHRITYSAWAAIKPINVERVGYKPLSPKALYFRVPNWH